MPINVEENRSEEIRWTDARIRWPEDADNEQDRRNIDGTAVDDDEEGPLQDPFKDADPLQTFSFQFVVPRRIEDDDKIGDVTSCSTTIRTENTIVDIEIKGYKDDSDQVWESTGLTVWRAAEHLCNYITNNVDLFEGKRILELGAGLGLCGILAFLSTTNSTICMTDGDTDALVYLRQNADHNRSRKRISGYKTDTLTSGTLSCHQLLWGHDTAIQFLQRHSHHDSEQQQGLFDVVIASDIIYAASIIEPLWETIQTLLDKNDGIFVMTFARRKVPVSIEDVLQSANKAGFVYQGGEDKSEKGVFTYTFRWKDHN